MADHHTHRPRNLATPDRNLDPTLKRQSKSAHPDQTHFSATMSNHLSRLNLYSHRSQKPSNQRALDSRLQGRAMTVSVDAADSSSSIKPQKSRRAKDEAKERDKLREELVRCQKSVKQKGDDGKNGKEKQPAAIGVPVGGRRRRRSFSGSQVELDDVFASCGAKIVAVDMPPFMQIHAVDCARKTHDSLEKFTAKALALTLKREFDGVYGPAWHCIVGKSFGSFVTHSVGGFLYFSMDHKLYILLFKTTVQRAD